MGLLQILGTGRPVQTASRNRQRNRARFQIEALEGRIALSTFTVSSAADSGAGSLRQAVISANAASDAVTINFNTSLQNTTITPQSALPELNNRQGITINGATGLKLNLAKSNVQGDGTGLRVDLGTTANLSGLWLDSSAGRGIGNYGTLRLTNVTIASSRDGGILNYGNLTLSNSTLSDNTAINYGGGIFNSGGTVAIHGGSFLRNSARYGGAINAWGGTMTVDGLATFDSNTASVNGGAFSIDNQASVAINATLRSVANPNHLGGSDDTTGGSVFKNNRAQLGGAINNRAALSVTGATFQQNSAVYGGAIFDMGTQQTVLTSNTFTANRATAAGGALFLDGQAAKLVDNNLYDNTAPSGSDLSGAVDPTSSLNVIGTGSGFTGILDNNPAARTGYRANKPTNFIGTNQAKLRPSMVQTGTFEGMQYTYTYLVRNNSSSLNINAGTGGHRISLLTVTPDLNPGDPNPYPSNRFPIGLQFVDNNESSGSIALWQGYNATTMKDPTLTITLTTPTSGTRNTIVDNLAFYTHTWNGTTVNQPNP